MSDPVMKCSYTKQLRRKMAYLAYNSSPSLQDNQDRNSRQLVTSRPQPRAERNDCMCTCLFMISLHSQRVQDLLPGDWCHPGELGLPTSVNWIEIVSHRHTHRQTQCIQFLTAIHVLGPSRLYQVDNKRGWRDSSVVKGTCCSWREPMLSQYTHWRSQPS